MAAGRIAGKEIGLPDLSNQRAVKESYGIHTWITGKYAAGAIGTLSAEVMTGGSWTVTTVGGNKVATMVQAGIDVQPGDTPARLTVTTVDAASDDLAGTLEIRGRNAFGDPVTEEVAIVAGADAQTTDGAWSEITQLKVTMATGIYDASDTIALATVANEIPFGPVNPNIVVSGASAFPHILLVQRDDGDGLDDPKADLSLKANNAAADGNTVYSIANISANGECCLKVATAVPDAKMTFMIRFRYQGGTAL